MGRHRIGIVDDAAAVTAGKSANHAETVDVPGSI